MSKGTDDSQTTRQRPTCPACGQTVPHTILSPRARAEHEYARKRVGIGGTVWAGARPAYEAGNYRDAELTEMLSAGVIEPHPDPTKGWIVR